jgi:hypothetical protein
MTRLRTAVWFVVGVLAVGACGGRVPSLAETTSPGADDPPLAVDPAGDAGAPGAQDAASAPVTPHDAGSPWDSGAPSTIYPVPHPAMATIVSSGGGVLHAPRIVPITFDGDPFRATIDDFVNALGGSTFWAAATAEYGIGPATAGAPIHAPDTPPVLIDDTQIQRWLRSRLDGTHAEWGAPDEETIYALYYPAGVTVSLEGYASCDVFGGYHAEVQIGQKVVPYAVIPRCASFADVHGFDVITVASSHEFIEAATDPRPFTKPAFAQPDDDHAIWGLFAGGEVGDMCTFNEGAFYTPPDFPFKVQRTWSNAAAAAGHDPCAPSLPSEVYFNTAPVLDHTVMLEGTATKGINIPIGGHATIELVLYSDGPTSGPWRVKARDLSEIAGGPPVLAFSFDRASGVNGERIHMTIDVLGVDAQYGGEGFVVISELNGHKSYWYGYVAN